MQIFCFKTGLGFVVGVGTDSLNFFLVSFFNDISVYFRLFCVIEYVGPTVFLELYK